MTTTHFGPESQAMTLEQIGRGYDAGHSKEGNMSATKSANVVPMARGVPTTTTTTPPPTTWPCPPYPPPGCAPPACPPSSLMQCYCDVQQAMQFISTIMIDLINNNPDVTQAIIAAIEASGSTLPLIGVTNGSVAQPGQVGEYAYFTATANYPTTQNFTQTLTMGILQPGDWECQIYAYEPTISVTSLNIVVQPTIPTTNGVLQAFSGSMTGSSNFLVLVSPTAQVTCSVPSLVAITVLTNQSGVGAAAGSCSVYFHGRRMR